jgi:hypothetical protein
MKKKFPQDQEITDSTDFIKNCGGSILILKD